MKNVKLILLAVTAMLFLGVGNVGAQENENKTVIIRIIESSKTGAINSEMVTITPTGEKQIISLLVHKFTNYSEVIGENGVIIQQEITKWLKQGFRITNFSTDGGDVYQRTFIIMTKE